MNANTSLPADYLRMDSFSLPWPKSPLVMVTLHVFPRGLDPRRQCRKHSGALKLVTATGVQRAGAVRRSARGMLAELDVLPASPWKPS